jgi:hypothetical protein
MSQTYDVIDYYLSTVWWCPCYVTTVYVNCWSWHVHGSHSVCLLKPGVTVSPRTTRRRTLARWGADLWIHRTTDEELSGRRSAVRVATHTRTILGHRWTPRTPIEASGEGCGEEQGDGEVVSTFSRFSRFYGDYGWVWELDGGNDTRFAAL